MRITRATIVGIIVGLLLLGAFAGFAIGLPKLVKPSLPTLPDSLGGTMVAVGSATPDQLVNIYRASASSVQQVTAQAASITASARTADKTDSDSLTKLYGKAEVRSYADATAPTSTTASSSPATVTITVVTGTPGLVIPYGPSQGTSQGLKYSLSNLDGFQCASTSVDQSTSTTPVTGTSYGTTECRIQEGELTYDGYATRISPDQVVAYLKSVIAGS